jgi:hypothetical protein
MELVILQQNITIEAAVCMPEMFIMGSKHFHNRIW